MIRLAVALVVVAAPALAQQQTRGATIFGTVRDSIGQPIPAVDIVAQPGSHRTRSDSAGNYLLSGLDDGTYVVAARKVGYAPERWDVKLSKNGRLEVKFTLGRSVRLDTVVVVARANCPPYTFNGFLCRRKTGGGVFLDYDDIDEQRVYYTADLFKNIEGFRVELRRSRSGPIPVPARRGFGCINSLVDGREVTPANPVPLNPGDLTAIEVYLRPDSVPEPYQRHTWPTNLARQGRCSVIVYWTIWAPMTAK